jgi:hypothetical protein
MKLILARDPVKVGRSDEWSATSEGLRGGIGKNRTEALGSFFAANIRAFGITEQEDRDPGNAENPVVTWRA